MGSKRKGVVAPAKPPKDPQRAKPRRRGAPTIFTPELGAEVAKLIAAGNYIEVAAVAAGLARTTFYKWLRQGVRELKAGKATELAEFAHAIKRAEARAEARDVVTIGSAARRQWQAAAWRLERKYPKRWARTERHEVSGRDGGPVDMRAVRDYSALNEEQLKALAALDPKLLKAK